MAERWLVEFGGVRVRVDDFAWRKGALECHDLHHSLTGYAHSPTGEMEIAAWESAAGPYASPWAYLMCLPLDGAGALLIPERTFAAFVSGRRSRITMGKAIHFEQVVHDWQENRHVLHLPLCGGFLPGLRAR